jgi:hypothetical protein
LCLWGALWKWTCRSLSNVVPSNFVWSLANPLLWLTKSYQGLMENIPYQGHKSFLEGREQVKDKPIAGRLSTSEMDDNVERVRSLVRSDRLTLRMISTKLRLNWFTIHQILTRHHDHAPCHTAVSINDFWQTEAFLSFLSPTRRISVPVASFYSPSSKITWKAAILVLWIISRRA